MGLRKFKPTTNGLRHTVISDFAEITKSTPEKALLEPLRKSGGRNSYGRVTMRFRGGGHKRMYRVIDFKRDRIDAVAKVVAIEYDPNRSARIALIQYADGVKNYILAPLELQVGHEVISTYQGDVEMKPGNCLPIGRIPLGRAIHNIELVAGHGGQIVRSAGTSAQIMAKEGDFAHVRLPSSEIRKIKINCRATIGQMGNVEHDSLVVGKAGRSNWLGRKAHVRGGAMNPHDHPHGGGEGKAPQGNPHPVTPWGKPTKGYKTRKRRKYSDRFIVKRRMK
ncbi:MAG TPA: 50S ribosomal protein L2 [Candidatus Omnitrophota bacterium]|nr:50S ribosomal protein L2 [Candidatus Omnitrophota bacterium]HPD83963.1 50S ribosomal protein L2 [Candidatus Omnitrophota bacterium]HRZ02820.1 50S ribosomal protein L2 [Candidatus Omnitrophota bacterium]